MQKVVGVLHYGVVESIAHLAGCHSAVVCLVSLGSRDFRRTPVCLGIMCRLNRVVRGLYMFRFLRPVLFVCGILVLIMSGLMACVALFAWVRQDPEMEVFLISCGITLAFGLMLVLGCLCEDT